MGRRVKAFKIQKKYLFIGIGVAFVSLAVVVGISLSLTSCRRNPLMSYIEHSGITVKVDGKTIEKGVSHDLGRVKQGGSYEDTFTIINSGNKDLELTGSPFVRISDDPFEMFEITQQPSTNLIRVRSDLSFILSYIPEGDGLTEIQLHIDNNSRTSDFFFDLIMDVDGTVPTILGKSPEGTGFPINVVVSATFSEDMDAEAINETTFTLTKFGDSVPVDATVTYDASTCTAYLDPTTNLEPSANYTAKLSKTIADLVGNPISVGADPSWPFQTRADPDPDEDPPKVVTDSLFPAQGADDVPLDTVVSAEFNEDILESSVLSRFKLLKGAEEIDGEVTYSVATTTATFTPDLDLDPSTEYTARFMAGIEDTMGNATVSTHEWTFTTTAGEDNDPPIVVSRNPDINEPGVPTNITVISALFNEPVTGVSSSTFTLSETFGDPVTPLVVEYNAVEMKATFDPELDLTPSTRYTVTLASGITDGAGNNLSLVTWDFETGAGADLTAPTVSPTNPVIDDIDVPVDVAITATFDEVMDATTINDTSFTLEDDEATLVPGQVTYDNDMKTATFVADNNLNEARIYTALITTDVEDIAGNALASNFSWSFTTVPGIESPEVLSVEPADGADEVDAIATITVEFSKLMDDDPPGDTINPTTFKVSVLETGDPVTGTVTYSSSTRTATFDPSSDLADETTYKVECTAGMKDIGGNALSYFSSIFTTSAGNKWGSLKWGFGKWAQ